MDDDQIERGDTVQVLLVGEALKGTVVHVPNTVDRCWVIRESASETLNYIKDFHRIVLVCKGSEDD